jgi:hypothetical protein
MTATQNSETTSMIFYGYFIGGERMIRAATRDELACRYHKFRVHEFGGEATAEAWLADGTLPISGGEKVRGNLCLTKYPPAWLTDGTLPKGR